MGFSDLMNYSYMNYVKDMIQTLQQLVLYHAAATPVIFSQNMATEIWLSQLNCQYWISIDQK